MNPSLYPSTPSSSHDQEDGILLRVARDGQAGCTNELIDDFYAREDSMEITNDPRFFSGNVIDKRLTAFGSVGIISGFMISVTFNELNDMDKNIDFPPWGEGGKGFDDCVQLVAFGILTYALFCNMVATFVAVAQTYYTYRLMTAGPIGFEMATKFYLDAYITWWRHYAIKHVLVSLPLLIIGHGGRMMRKFDNAHNSHEHGIVRVKVVNTTVSVGHSEDTTIGGHSVYGIVAMLGYMAIGAILLSIHWKHRQRFGDFYEDMPKDMQIHKMQRGGAGSQRNMRPEI